MRIMRPWGVKSCQVMSSLRRRLRFWDFCRSSLGRPHRWPWPNLAKLGQTLRSSSEFLWWDVAHLWRASWWKGSWMAPESCPEKDVHGGSTPCDILWQDHYLELKTQMGMGTGSSNLFCVSGVSGLDCLTWSCQLLVVAPQGRKPTLTFSLTAAALLSYASATARSLHMCLIQGLEKSEDSHCRRIFWLAPHKLPPGFLTRSQILLTTDPPIK